MNTVYYTAPYELKRGTEFSAGLDLVVQSARCEDGRDNYVPTHVMLGTGVRLFFPHQTPHHWAQVSMRSSTYRKFGITLANASGIIDSDYTGEIILSVLLKADVDKVQGWMGLVKDNAVAQLTFIGDRFNVCRCHDHQFNYLLEQRKNGRGSGGFGSTDK